MVVHLRSFGTGPGMIERLTMACYETIDAADKGKPKRWWDVPVPAEFEDEFVEVRTQPSINMNCSCACKPFLA